MAYHINNTNRPVRFKTWSLKSYITKDTATFLLSIGVTVRAFTEPQEVISSGHTYQYNGHPRIELESTSDEQETMLKLKFGTDIVLIMDEYVLPNSMSLCTLNTMVF